VEPSPFDELAFFRAVRSRTRALLIGRRALVLLGLPVLTAEYDFWLALEDISAFNALCQPFGLLPTRTPEEARRTGRYVLENDEHVDVLVARSVPTVDGRAVEFQGLWDRRQAVRLSDDVEVQLPTIDDLILTKQVASRPKDLEDIRLLNALRSEGR
jgi:predicted nucleotidyltransferase